MRRSLKFALALGLLTGAAAVSANDGTAGENADEIATDIDEGFRDPPMSARPRTWWHWLNGNVTVEGIEKDIDWLASVGMGGIQNFDANLTTPQIVENRLVYMEPDWKAAFRRAVELADAKGLEFAIAASPGWSETGGPWVAPEDGMKKLTWSETIVPGGRRIAAPIAAPPGATGPYQDVHAEILFGDPDADLPELPQAGGDIAILAVPLQRPAAPQPVHAIVAGERQVAADALSDADVTTAMRIDSGTEADPATLALAYPRPVTIGSARLFIKDAHQPFGPPRYTAMLQAAADGGWQEIADIPLGEAATTVSFAPVTASRFRLAIRPGSRPDAGGLGSVPGAVVMELFPQPDASQVTVGQFQLFADQRVHRAETKAGFGTVPNYYALDSDLPTRGPAPGEVLDLTDRLRADGTLDWTPPAGSDWRVLRFGWSLTGKTNHPATPEATGLEVDKYDAAAVERYLDGYLALYRDAVGEENIGAQGIRALLTDSIEVGAANWTPSLIEEFRARRGYDPLPWMPALAGTVIGSAAETDKFLYDYRRTLGDLMADAHYGTIARVAHENGLKVYGEAHEDGRPVLGDDLDMRHYADVPMSALWTFPRGGDPRPGLMGDMKGAASVAHFYGQNLVAAESMTSAFSPWAFAPHDLKRVIDLEFAQGVNRPVVHTSVHVPTQDKLPGLSLAIFGQYFNRNETWAGMARPWIDYVARSAFLLQQGRDGADVAVFYGEDTPVATMYSRGVPDWLPRGYAYDFVNWKMLDALTVDDEGRMNSPGGASYRVLYLAGTTDRMTVPALRALHRLADAGVPIIGKRPTASPSLPDDKAQFDALVAEIWSRPNVTEEADFTRGIARVGLAPDFAVGDADADLRFVHRKLPDGDIYFVNNRENRPVSTEVIFRVAGKVPELWQAIDGTKRPLAYATAHGRTNVALNLGPEDAVFVIFRDDAAVPARGVAETAWHDVAAVDGPWQVSFQPDRGAPEAIAMDALVPLDTHADPGVRYFAGEATYATTIDRPSGLTDGAPLWLDLGAIGDIAEVSVNGKVAGITWFAPYRVEIGSLLKQGRNRIEVKVANLWVNRLIGDQQEGIEPITWTAVPTYRADAPLRPSGLIGPVTLKTHN